MEIQIILMSTITYLLLLNTCLTFRLNIIQNIVAVIIITFNIVFVGKQIGNFFVIPMFIILILYVVWLKREDWIINVFLMVLSYTILVIVDNSTNLIWNITELNIGRHWPIYIFINYPIFLITFRLMSKKVIQLRKKETLMLSVKILSILVIDLTLCMLIFVMHIMVTEQAGSSTKVLVSSIVLYIAYFILTFVMVTMIAKEYDKNAKIMLKQNSYDNLRDYMFFATPKYNKVQNKSVTP